MKKGNYSAEQFMRFFPGRNPQKLNRRTRYYKIYSITGAGGLSLRILPLVLRFLAVSVPVQSPEKVCAPTSPSYGAGARNSVIFTFGAAQVQ